MSILNDEEAIIETSVEREFIAVLEGGCQVPIGVNAEVREDALHVKAILGLPDCSELIMEEITVHKNDYVGVGKELANRVVAKGAKALL